MATAEPHVRTVRPTGDFAANAPLLRRSLFAVAIGGISTLGARVLLGAISLFTNIFYYGSLSFSSRSPADNHLGYWATLDPPSVGHNGGGPPVKVG